TGERADHELWHAKGESTHRRGADRRAGGAAQAEDAIDLALAMQLGDELGRAACRRFNGFAAIVGFDDGVEGCAGSGEYLIARQVRREGRRAEYAGVDDQRVKALRLKQITHELEFDAFC